MLPPVLATGSVLTNRLPSSVRVPKAHVGVTSVVPPPPPFTCSPVPCRNTFHCYVIGPHGSGKSALVRALAPRPDSGKQGPCVAAGAVQTDGRDKVLVMSEVRRDTEARDGGVNGTLAH